MRRVPTCRSVVPDDSGDICEFLRRLRPTFVLRDHKTRYLRTGFWRGPQERIPLNVALVWGFSKLHWLSVTHVCAKGTDVLVQPGARHCRQVPQGPLERRRSRCMLPHESPDVPYSLSSPRKTWLIITTARALCMIHFRAHAIPSHDRRGESLASGNWTGLNSFSASDSKRTPVHTPHQRVSSMGRVRQCIRIALSNFVPLSPHFSAMCESGAFYFKLLPRCWAPQAFVFAFSKTSHRIGSGCKHIILRLPHHLPSILVI